MTMSMFSNQSPTLPFESLNWVATDALPRDCEQSHRLHEPRSRVDATDPMTGDEIEDVSGHPSLVDGELTIYFLNEESRKAFIDLPINHPAPHVPFEAGPLDDRGG